MRFQPFDQSLNLRRNVDSDGSCVLLVLDFVAFVNDIIPVCQPLNMIGRKVGHIDERHSVAVVRKKKELPGVFVLGILCGPIFEFLQVLRREVAFLDRFFQLGNLEPLYERIGRSEPTPSRFA